MNKRNQAAAKLDTKRPFAVFDDLNQIKMILLNVTLLTCGNAAFVSLRRHQV